MNDETTIWQKLKAGYLRRVEAALATVYHPRKQEVLDDLSRHLELRFDELDPQQRTAARLEELVEEMGAPEEYADLLAPEGARRTGWPIPWRTVYRNPRWLALPAVIALLVVTAAQPGLTLPVFRALNVLLFMGVALALFIQYRRSRDNGLLWLAGALVVWPLLLMAIGWQSRSLIDRVAAGQKVWLWPFCLAARGEVSLGMVLVAVAYWQRFVTYVLLVVGIMKLKLSSESGERHLEGAQEPNA